MVPLSPQLYQVALSTVLEVLLSEHLLLVLQTLMSFGPIQVLLEPPGFQDQQGLPVPLGPPGSASPNLLNSQSMIVMPPK
ncbi:hypothetical protein SDJN03_30190, partial [Cucurbita argyrosperma subsp. sororia]